jgi:putative phosphoribosyl transferase
MTARVHDLPELRERVRVFRGREDAGRTLAGMLKEFEKSNAVVVGIPSGGLPVAAEIARELKLPLMVAVASKITPAWNTEAGYGAVAFDGTVLLNEEALPHFHVNQEEILQDTERALAKVRRRMRLFYGDRRIPSLKGKTVVLVDDGIAAGVTITAAVMALKNQGARRIIVAVPTGHLEALGELARRVDAIYCANIRSGPSFAVAAAYKEWYDVTEDEAIGIAPHGIQL